MNEVKQITDEVFLKAWMENGYNAKQAYLSLKPDVTNDSARTLGALRLAKCKKGDIYQSLLSDALEVMRAGLDSKDEKIRHLAAKEFLDRGHGKASESIKIEANVRTEPNEEQLKKFAQYILNDGKC